MTTYNKLVRDNIPEYLESKGIAFEQRIATDVEYRLELFKKLSEEVLEFKDNYAIEELADIIEVINAIKELSEFADVETIRENKLKEKGGFSKKIILKGEYK